MELLEALEYKALRGIKKSLVIYGMKRANLKGEEKNDGLRYFFQEENGILIVINSMFPE